MTRARSRRASAAAPAPASTESGALNSTVEFGAPVPVGRQPRYDWEAIGKRLRRKPGEWGRIFEQDKASIATAIRAGNVAPMRPSKGFEVRTSNNDHSASPRTCSLWLRYVPEKDIEKEMKK